MTPEYRDTIAAAMQTALRAKTSREFVVTAHLAEDIVKDLLPYQSTHVLPPVDQIFGAKVTFAGDTPIYSSTIISTETPLEASVFDMLIDDMSSELLKYLMDREKRHGRPAN